MAANEPVPAEPEAGETVWFRGWEIGFEDMPASYGCEGWRAYRGGCDLDAPTCSARTFEGVISEINDEEDC